MIDKSKELNTSIRLVNNRLNFIGTAGENEPVSIDYILPLGDNLGYYEERVINDIANLNSIAFWTRNIERKGFCINGFLNHYPDFIIQTKSGKTLILETKGDHLDAEQKIRLGNLWASKSGNNFRYFMVYEKREVSGAYKLDDFINIVREI